MSSFGQSSVGYRYEKSVLQSLLSLLSYFATSSDRRSMLGRFVALVLPSGGPTSQDKSHQALLQPGTFLNEGTDTKKNPAIASMTDHIRHTVTYTKAFGRKLSRDFWPSVEEQRRAQLNNSNQSHLSLHSSGQATTAK